MLPDPQVPSSFGSQTVLRYDATRRSGGGEGEGGGDMGFFGMGFFGMGFFRSGAGDGGDGDGGNSKAGGCCGGCEVQHGGSA